MPRKGTKEGIFHLGCAPEEPSWFRSPEEEHEFFRRLATWNSATQSYRGGRHEA